MSSGYGYSNQGKDASRKNHQYINQQSVINMIIQFALEKEVGEARRKGPKKYAADRGQNALKTATAPLGVA